MKDTFVSISPEEVTDNPFKLIGTDWMLITAGDAQRVNTMTASWGGLGILWNKKVCFCFIRPSRFTYGLMETGKVFTLSFFEEKFRNVLNYCGSNSGRDVDKVAATGLTPVHSPSGSVYFQEARLVLDCRKLYYHDFETKNFLDGEIEKNYNGEDYHRMYVGEITGCYLRTE